MLRMPMIAELFTHNDFIDVIIPRGSYTLTSAVAKKSRIPVLYHAAGGARMYIDQSADLKQAIKLCIIQKRIEQVYVMLLMWFWYMQKLPKQFFQKLIKFDRERI